MSINSINENQEQFPKKMLGDKKLLQIIETLLVNSFFKLERKDKIIVKISFNQQQNMLIFCIEDTSIGLKKSEHAKINKLLRKKEFHPCPILLNKIKKYPFFLGLFTSNYHIRQNNGQLFFYSDKHRGNKVIFTFNVEIYNERDTIPTIYT